MHSTDTPEGRLASTEESASGTALSKEMVAAQNAVQSEKRLSGKWLTASDILHIDRVVNGLPGLIVEPTVED